MNWLNFAERELSTGVNRARCGCLGSLGMTSLHSRNAFPISLALSGSRRSSGPRRLPGSRSLRAVAALATVAFLSVTIGCSAVPASLDTNSATPGPTPSPTPERTSEDLTFARGIDLTKDSDISWGDGLVSDAGWVSVPSEQPGRWSYANAAGTCTASFRGGVLGDASGMDDREATDALIAYQAGDDFTGPEMLMDGHFLLHEGDGAGVDHRQFSYTFNEFGYFMAARAFVEADYSVWVIVACEGEAVGPVAHEVLSKNVIAVDAPEG